MGHNQSLEQARRDLARARHRTESALAQIRDKDARLATLAIVEAVREIPHELRLLKLEQTASVRASYRSQYVDDAGEVLLDRQGRA